MAEPNQKRQVLVSGGTGKVGQHAVVALEKRSGVVARVLSRRERPHDLPPHRQWVQADMRTDDLASVAEGVDAIIHLASGKTSSDDDLNATRRLLAAAQAASVRHFVVVSIIGCDRIPLPFYRTKRDIEAAVRASAIPWSIARAAQFHSFVERLVAAAATSPIPTPLVSDLRFQPVDEGEVAERLVEIALGPALGDAPEIAGPEVLSLSEIAATWLKAQGSGATLVPLTVDTLFSADPAVPPWAHPVLEGYRDAWNTPHGERTLGRITFAEWLARRRALPRER